MANFTWKSKEQLNQEKKEQSLEALRSKRNNELRETDYLLLPDAPITPEELQEVTSYRQGLRDATDAISSAPDYVVGFLYVAGNVFLFDGDAYVVVKSHTSQLDWVPSENPALYRNLGNAELLVEEGYPQWVQPTGAHDAYNTGDKVLYNDTVYESLIDGNTWSPDDYPQGWQLGS